jgi:uncharacterized protein YcnI
MENVACAQSTRYSASVTYTTRVLVATAFILTKKAHCRISISRSPITHDEKLRHLLRVRVEEEFGAIKRLNFKVTTGVGFRGESPFPQYILSVAHFSLVNIC